MYCKKNTLLYWNILVAVGVLCSLGYELDPVLYLGHPGIHTVAGTLAPVTYNTNLGESKYIEVKYFCIFMSDLVFFWKFYLFFMDGC